MTEIDVQEFCTRYQCGDYRTCLSLLYRCLKSPVTGRFRTLTGCDEDAAELTQRAFFEAASHLGKIRQPEQVASWFWGTVVRNVQTAYFREKKKQKAWQDGLRGSQEPLDSAPATSMTVEQSPSAATQAVIRFAEQLKNPYDRLIVLHKNSGRTFKEIADILFWKEPRVKRRFQRLMQKIPNPTGEDLLP